LAFVFRELRFLNAANDFAGFARWFCGSKFDSNWIGRRVIGVWSIVRIPAGTLADGKVKKHPLEYGFSKVFARAPRDPSLSAMASGDFRFCFELSEARQAPQLSISQLDCLRF